LPAVRETLRVGETVSLSRRHASSYLEVAVAIESEVVPLASVFEVVPLSVGRIVLL